VCSPTPKRSNGWLTNPPPSDCPRWGQSGGCGITPDPSPEYGRKDNTMQAITTKYFGPGNARGSRLKAECDRGSLTVEWDYSQGVDENHARAARALLDRFALEDVAEYGGRPEDHHWGKFVSGTTKAGVGVHVLTGREGAR